MKKTYIIPVTKVESTIVEEMIASSITNIGGNSGLGFGAGDVPANADVKESDGNSWEIDW